MPIRIKKDDYANEVRPKKGSPGGKVECGLVIRQQMKKMQSSSVIAVNK